MDYSLGSILLKNCFLSLFFQQSAPQIFVSLGVNLERDTIKIRMSTPSSKLEEYVHATIQMRKFTGCAPMLKTVQLEIIVYGIESKQ